MYSKLYDMMCFLGNLGTGELIILFTLIGIPFFALVVALIWSVIKKLLKD